MSPLRLPLLLLLVAVGLADARASADDAPFVVVVHPRNPTSRVSRDFLADVFLKRTSRWGSRDAILPVDLPIGSNVRRRFVERVLGRTIGAVRAYWQQIIFSGRGLPPVEVDSDAAVLSYVKRHDGGIGYVSPGTAIAGVKALTIR